MIALFSYVISGGEDLSKGFMRYVTTKATKDIDLHQKDHKTNSIIAWLFLNAFTCISKYSCVREVIHDYPGRNMVIHLHKNWQCEVCSQFFETSL